MYSRRTVNHVLQRVVELLTWQGLVCMRLCSCVSRVPPITTCTPIDGWYFKSLLASAATWFASSLVGHRTRTLIDGLFCSRSTRGNLERTSIAGSWNWTLSTIIDWKYRVRYITEIKQKHQGQYQKGHCFSCSSLCLCKNIVACKARKVAKSYASKYSSPLHTNWFNSYILMTCKSNLNN